MLHRNRADIFTLFSVLGGNCSVLHTLNVAFVVGFCCCHYCCCCLWRSLPDWESFLWAEWVLNFSSDFSASIIFLLYFCNVVNYIDFQMLYQSCIPGQWCRILFYIFPDSIYYFLFRIFAPMFIKKNIGIWLSFLVILSGLVPGFGWLYKMSWGLSHPLFSERICVGLMLFIP